MFPVDSREISRYRRARDEPFRYIPRERRPNLREELSVANKSGRAHWGNKAGVFLFIGSESRGTLAADRNGLRERNDIGEAAKADRPFHRSNVELSFRYETAGILGSPVCARLKYQRNAMHREHGRVTCQWCRL